MPTLSDCPGAPKLDPRVRRTRRLLEESLRELMREKPYRSISVGDITERATVNRATFYAHYIDKLDLTTSLLANDLHHTIISALGEPRPLDREALTLFASAVFEFMARTMGACPKEADEFAPHVAPTIQSSLEDFLRHWFDRDPHAVRRFAIPNRETLASLLAWSLYGSGFRWAKMTRRPPVKEAVAEVIAVLMPVAVAVA